MRYCLALDAKNLGVVLKDADLENAVNECVLGSLSYNGQRCTALKLLLVHKVPLPSAPPPPCLPAAPSLCWIFVLCVR